MMAQNSVLLDKSLLFAARIVKLNKYLVKEKRETVISKQILRSATSIGANANEAIYGIQQSGFYCKTANFIKRNRRNGILAPLTSFIRMHNRRRGPFPVK